MAKNELRQRKGDKEKDESQIKETTSNSAEDANFALEARYRWFGKKIIRLTMLIIACITLSREDFATAFGMKSGINRLHVSPVGVLCNAAHHSEFLKSNFKVKSAVIKMLRTASIPGEVYSIAKLEVLGAPSNLGKRQLAEIDARRQRGALDAAARFVEDCRGNTGMTKLTKENYALITGSFLILVGSLVGILVIPAGFPTVLTGMMAFVFGIQQSSENNGQVNSFFFGCIAVTCTLYFIADYLTSYKVKSKKTKEKKAKKSAANEWDDGYGSK